MIAHIDEVETNERTTDVVADQTKISDRPNYEVQILFFLKQAVNDIAINVTIQN
jgi:hypothetical protein